jgi:hypothetical protein
MSRDGVLLEKKTHGYRQRENVVRYVDPQVAVAYAGKLGLTDSIQPVIYESILFPYHD